MKAETNKRVRVSYYEKEYITTINSLINPLSLGDVEIRLTGVIEQSCFFNYLKKF
jgi:hypothetical protein